MGKWEDYAQLAINKSAKKNGYGVSTNAKTAESDSGSSKWDDYVSSTLGFKSQVNKPNYSNTAKKATANTIKHTAKAGTVVNSGSADTLNGKIKNLTAERDNLVYQGRFDMYNNPYESRITDLNKQLSSLNTELNTIQNSQKYNALSGNADFSRKSQANINFNNWQTDKRLSDNDFLSVNNVGGMQNFLDNSDTHDKQSVYKYMTAEEVSNYNYLYNSQGKKEAEAYIDYLYNDMDKRMTADTTQKMSQYATDHPVAASIGSVPTNIFGGVAGTASIVGQNISNALKKNMGEAVDPVDYDTYGMLGSAMTNTLRGTVSANLNENGTVDIPVIGEKGLGDLYQLGMSMVDSYTLAVTGGKATNLVLGASAAASGFKNAKEKGLSDDQAFLLGGANGIFEALFEEVSIDRLLKIKDARTMGQFIENVLKQSFTEGSEEFFTTIANTIADQIISGDKSDINKSIAGYTSEGMSAEEAKKQAWKDWGSSLAWDFVGGALTGGIMGGVQTGVQTAMQNSVYNETGKQINDKGKPELLKKLSEQYGNEINLGEDTSTKQIGQAYFDLQNKYEGEYSSNIQSAILDRLKETGMDDATAEKAQAAVSKVLNNEKLGITDTKILSDKRVQSVIDEISNGSDWTNNIADKNNLVSEKAKLLNRTLNSQSKSLETENTYTPEINTEKLQNSGFSKNSEVGSISNVSVTDDGNTGLTFSDGTQKNFADVDLRDTELNDVIMAASQYGSDANNMVLGYTAENASKSLSERQSADAYIRQYNNAYDYGKMGASLEYTQKSGVANMLTKEQLEMAYNTGVKAGYKETSAKQHNINELRNAGQKKQGTVNTKNLSEKTRRNLNADQKTVISFAKQLSKYSGINITFEESAVNEKGDYTSPNGWIDGSGTIHIDINAGADNVSSDRTFLGYTLSHELTHFAEQWAPEDYKKYSDFVVNIITQNKDVSIEAMLQHKKDSYFNGELSRLKQTYPSVSEEKLKQYVTSMSDETALKEVVADGSQMILSNSDLIERLASHDKTLFEKVKTAVLKIIGDIKNLYKGYMARGAESKATSNYLDELTEMWTNMQEKAVQSYNESEIKNNDDKPYQERTSKSDDRERIVSLLEGSDLNAAERELLKSYKSKIEDLNKKEADYNELRLKLNEIMYMKGTRQSEIDSLTKRRDYLRNQIARQDMKLTKFESMETMKNLISKERAIAIKNYKEGREASQTREQIKKIVKDFNARLMRPTKKKYIPVSFTRMVIDFCDSINMDDPRIKSQSTKERLAKIRDTYKSYKEDSTYDYVYDEVVADMLDNLQAEIEDVPLNKMTNKQLKYLKDCMTALHKNVTQATRLFSEEYKQDIFETGKKVMTEVSEATFIHHKFTKVFDAAQDIALWQLSPDRFFSYLSGFKKDSTCDAIGRTFKNATEKKLMVQRTFTELFRNYENIKFINSLSDTKNLVDIGLKDSMGKPVMLTRGMMLSVYKHLSSEDNKRAFAYGGFTVPEIKQYYNGKAKDAFARGNIRTLPANTELIGLYEKNMEKLNELNDLQEFKDLEGTDQDKMYDIYDEIEILEEKIAKAEEIADNEIKKIREKCEDIMTADERSFIDTTTEWYDKHSRDYINEVTLKMYGIKKAGVKNYYTIHRDASYFNTQFESMVNNITLENWGSIKDRVKSVAPLMLTDILMELQSSVQQVSSYYGYVEATRDFNRLYNIRNKDYSMSVKEAIKGKAGAGSRKFGVTGEQYIENLLTDLTGKGKKETSILEPVRRNLARATLSINIRVALSQAASIPTAAAEVGWKTMAKGYARGWAVGFSEAKKDELAEKNVWFWQRYRGEGSTREFAEMKGGSNPVDKAWSWIDEKTNRKLLNWCQNVDVYSTAAMYNMAEVYVEDVLGINKDSDNYNELVNDKFTDILRKTQPNYTTTERSDLLRDNRETYKILTMYKTQSNQNFNIMFESLARLSRYKSDYKNGRNEVTKADLDKAVNQCAGATTAVVIGGTITFAVLRFVANALQRTMANYRDDDDEVTLESILTGILKDSGSAISGCFVLGSQIYDILVSKFSVSNYYGLTDSALSAVSDIIEQIANGSGDAVSLTGKLLQVLGLPFRNVKNIVTGIQGYIDGIKNNNLFEFEDGAERTSSMQGDRMYKAIASGDSEKYKTVYSELYDGYISKGKTEEEADSQVKSALKKAVKSEYADSNISAEKAGDILKQYFDYSEDDVYWQLQEWDDKEFNKYNTMDEAIKSNSVTGVKKQSEYLQEHGISESAVNAHVTKTIGDMYKSGEISALEAKKRLMNISGKEEKEALKSINSWNEKSME